MLGSVHRLRGSGDFRATTRRGRKVATRTLVVHARTRAEGTDSSAEPVRIGFIVNKQVGTAVVRNRVKRQLCHLVADRIDQLPLGAHLVVRALPASARASSDVLDKDLGQALQRLAGV